MRQARLGIVQLFTGGHAATSLFTSAKTASPRRKRGDPHDPDAACAQGSSTLHVAGCTVSNVQARRAHRTSLSVGQLAGEGSWVRKWNVEALQRRRALRKAL